MEKKTSFIIPGSSLQFTPYQRPTDGGLFIALKDTIYQYSIERERLDTIIVNTGHPYFTAASSLVYDSVHDELISYSAEQERLNRYSFEKMNGKERFPMYFFHICIIAAVMCPIWNKLYFSAAMDFIVIVRSCLYIPSIQYLGSKKIFLI